MHSYSTFMYAYALWLTFTFWWRHLGELSVQHWDTLTHGLRDQGGDLLMFWLVDDCSTTWITAAHGIIIAYFTVSKFMFVRSGVIFGLDTVTQTKKGGPPCLSALVVLHLHYILIIYKNNTKKLTNKTSL